MSQTSLPASPSGAPRRTLPPAQPLRALAGLEVERVRLPLEREMTQRLSTLPEIEALAARIPLDPRAARRDLMATALRLSESMAPDLHAAAKEVTACLSVTEPIEIYQSAGAENAAMHFVQTPVLLEVQGRMLTLLDHGSRRALLGHELGHYLAHGPNAPDATVARLAYALAEGRGPSDDVRGLGRMLAMAKELTADRFGLLACQDLAAALRLEMIALTGLSGDALTWDTDVYLDQARALVEEELARNAEFAGVTHPEHSLRAYALWLFSETDHYKHLTGLGPGSRSLAEVNQQLSRCLGLARFDNELTSTEEEPPPELHAGALAACVIVAAADGEIADEELESLEASFGSLVPDSRRYFDVEYARSRFDELRPIVASLGARHHRALFALMAHIAVVDGVLTSDEVECIIHIGEQVRATMLFRRLLGALIQRLGAGAAAAPLQKPAPETAAPADALEGLRTYLALLARQGGGDTTLRRLLRLLGVTSLMPSARETLDRELAAASLRVESDYTELELDARITLRGSGRREAERLVANAPVDPTVAGLIRAIGRLRDRLVSGDGRSPSVRLRGPRSGRVFDVVALEEARIGQAERAVNAVRAGKEAQLVDATLAGTHRTAEALARELVTLYREHASRLEETGANDLALGMPLLSGHAGGYFVRGPLVLYPVDLVSSGRGARSFSVRASTDREPVANQALLRQVFAKRGFAYPDELAARFDELACDLATGRERMIEELAKVGLVAEQLASALVPLEAGAEAAEASGPNELRFEECAALGFFPQSGSALLQDYDGLLQDLEQGTRSPREVLAVAATLCPLEMREALGPALHLEAADESPLAPIIAADPSQRIVLEEARRQAALVVDGPPGTGKSQVIVNLVSDAVARGLRVAVVSEKRAALDVVASRLTDSGLGAAFALVHDVEIDRKPLYRSIADRMEAAPADCPATRSLATARAHQTTVEEALAPRARWLEAEVDLGGLSRGELHTWEAALGDYRPPIPLELSALGMSQMLELRPQVARLAEHADLLRPESVWTRPRASFAGWRAADFARLDRDLQHAASTAAQLEAARLGVPGVSSDSALAAERALTTAEALVTEWRDESAPLWSALVLAKQPPAIEVELAELTRSWQERREDVTRYPERVFFEATPEETKALAVGRVWAGRFWRFLSPAWWGVRSILAELTMRHGHSTGPTLQAVRELTSRVQHSEAWSRLETAFVRLAPRHLLPLRSEALPALFDTVGRVAAHVRALLRERESLSRIGAWPILPAAGTSEIVSHGESSMRAWQQLVAGRRTLLEAVRAHRTASETIVRVLPRLGVEPSGSALMHMRGQLAHEARRLAEMDGWVDAARPLLQHIEHVSAVLAQHVPQARWSDTLTAGWAASRRRKLEVEEPAVRMFDAGTPFGPESDAAAELARAEAAVVMQTQLTVRSKLDQAPLRLVGDAEKHARRTSVQKARETMLKECRKQRRLLPLRTFTRTFSQHGLLDLVPVWFLSPETLSVLFERTPIFDLLVIDEASQVPVENGVPALLRAKRVVVAGDDKQMPPTSFFTASKEEEDERDDPSTATEARDAFTSESLLTLARARCVHRGLAWHYRCLDEDLIAFSNHAMYGAGLLTIPASKTGAAEPCMRWESVEGGEFDKGRNIREAERVLDVFSELLARDDKPSIGVVTFNIAQKQAILDLIDERRAKDAEFAARYDAAVTAERLDERPFVKNLENVQGDERDVIVFSPAYAPVERKLKNGQRVKSVPARFGPLGLKGGERRLNVAISRAKRETIVVCSFDPDLLAVAKTRNPGPRLFKEYLVFARLAAARQRAQARRVLDRVVDDELRTRQPKKSRLKLPGFVPLALQIGEAMQKLGHQFETDVGHSEFRVPLAVLDPTNPKYFKLAVLTNEGREPGLTVIERWVHRKRVLEARGWVVEMVQAREWLLDPGAVTARLEKALRTG